MASKRPSLVSKLLLPCLDSVAQSARGLPIWCFLTACSVRVAVLGFKCALHRFP